MSYLAQELARIGAVDCLRHAAKVCERPIAYLSDYDLAAHLRDIAILIEKQTSTRWETTAIDRIRDGDAYLRRHSFCPKCGCSAIERTCIGFIVTDWSTHVDTNRATCRVDGCGWSGIVHDLTPPPLRHLRV